MKKAGLILGAVFLAAVFLTRCGGGDKKEAQSVSSAKDQFNSPNGNITSENATEVVNQAIDVGSQDAAGNAVEGLFQSTARKVNFAFNKKKVKFRLQGDIDADTFKNCVKADSDGKSGTVDVGCLSDANALQGSCTGSGTIKFKQASDTELEITLSGFSYTCPDEDNVSSCDGTINLEVSESATLFAKKTVIAQTSDDTSDTVACWDISCTVDEEEEASNGCIEGDGEKFLIKTADGESVVCVDIVPNADCTSVCTDWITQDGSAKIDCTVKTKGSSCPTDPFDIEEVSDCTVTQGASCST